MAVERKAKSTPQQTDLHSTKLPTNPVITGNGQEKFLPENLESFVLSFTRISFLDEFVIFKTPHNILGFYCEGTVTTIAKLETIEETTSVVFDRLNTICNNCPNRMVFPLNGDQTIQAIDTERKLMAPFQDS